MFFGPFFSILYKVRKYSVMGCQAEKSPLLPTECICDMYYLCATWTIYLDCFLWYLNTEYNYSYSYILLYSYCFIEVYFAVCDIVILMAIMICNDVIPYYLRGLFSLTCASGSSNYAIIQCDLSFARSNRWCFLTNTTDL